jgi:hypothetical protein
LARSCWGLRAGITGSGFSNNETRGSRPREQPSRRSGPRVLRRLWFLCSTRRRWFFVPGPWSVLGPEVLVRETRIPALVGSLSRFDAVQARAYHPIILATNLATRRFPISSRTLSSS